MVTARQDVFLSGAQDATVPAATVRATAAVPAPGVVTTSAPPGTFPIVASTDWGGGRPSERTLMGTYVNSTGYSGLVKYSGSGTPISWDSELQGLASDFPTFPFWLMQTFKNYSTSGMNSIMASMPASWIDGYIPNFWQEADRTYTGTAAQFRAQYNTIANDVRAYNAAHPTRQFRLPWPEFQEFATQTNAGAALVPFIPASADYQGILWSMFEYGEIYSTSRIQAQVDRIKTFMNTNAPGKLWGLMASCYTLEPVSGDDTTVGTYTATQKTNQANWLTEAYNRTKAAGCTVFGWYNVKFGVQSGTVGSNATGEGRVEVIPETLAAFKALDRTP